GYDVLEAGDGPEALGKARSHVGTIDALVTDVVMPEMHGPELAERIRRERPAIRVMFLSAYANELAEGGDVAALDAVFLAKPFRFEEFLSKLDGIVRSSSAPPAG